MFKVAMVGCGNIARLHADFLRKFNKTTIVGVCDKSLERARILSENYSIAYHTDSLAELLDECSPDVVHVLTPTSTHAQITLLVLKYGCHVFVEKPLCSSVKEGREIRKAVKESGKCCVVNHSLLGDPIYQKGKKVIEKKLIGDITHVDYLLSDDYLTKYKKGISRPWVSKQSLGVFHDLLPHPIYLIQDLIDAIQVNNVSIEYGNNPFPEFLQMFFTSTTGATASVTLSLHILPIQQKIQIFGNNGNILIDYRNFLNIFEKNIRLPQPIPRVYLNFSKSFQLLTQTIINYSKLFVGKIHPYKGLRNVIKNFYSSINNNTRPLISLEDGIKVVQIMNDIEKLTKEKSNITIESKNSVDSNILDKSQNMGGSSILVTGATGLLGSHLVSRLVSSGETIRVFCRESSDISKLPSKNIDIVYGDMRNIDKNQDLMERIDTVFHCASAMRGSWYDHYEVTVEGTRKLLDLCNTNDVRKFIHVSSMGIFNFEGFKNNQTINEDSELEKHHDYRGYYTKAKLLQENIVREYIKRDKINISVIRPAIIYDNDFSKFIGDAAFKINGLYLIAGIKNRSLRVVNINDLIDVLILLAKHNKARGKIYNITDSHLPTARRYCKIYLKHHQKKGVIIKIPAIFFYFLLGMLDRTISFLPGQNRRHLTYKFSGMIKNLKYDNSKIKNDLGWPSSNSLTG